MLICRFAIFGTETYDYSLISVIFFSSNLLMNKFSYYDWFACSFYLFCLAFTSFLLTYFFLFSNCFSMVKGDFDFIFFFYFGSLQYGLVFLGYFGLRDDCPLLENGERLLCSIFCEQVFLGVRFLWPLADFFSSPI
jgi:hypothetical protein